MTKGETELYMAGTVLLWNYMTLFDSSPPAFQRVDKLRMEQSYKAFLKGYRNSGRWNPPMPKRNEDVTSQGSEVTEAETVASTVVKDKVRPWRETFLPEITERLNKGLVMASGHHLDNDDALSIMELCAFLYARDWDLPVWHNIFTEQDWKHLEYERTLGKYYRVHGSHF